MLSIFSRISFLLLQQKISRLEFTEFFGGKCSSHIHSLSGIDIFEPNCRMQWIFMDSFSYKRRKKNPGNNT